MCNENNTCGHNMEQGKCGCGMSKCMGCLGGHRVIRFAVGFFLLWLVLTFGMEIGEMKSEISGGYGRGGMMMRTFDNGDQNFGYGMMGGRLERATVAAPAAPETAPAVKK